MPLLTSRPSAVCLLAALALIAAGCSGPDAESPTTAPATRPASNPDVLTEGEFSLATAKRKYVWEIEHLVMILDQDFLSNKEDAASALKSLDVKRAVATSELHQINTS